MNSLQRFDCDGIEIIIDLQNGETFASIRGYARMSGLSQPAISKRCTGDNQKSFKIAEIQTGGGLQRVKLIDEDTIVEWIIDDNPRMAKKLLKAGVRVYLHTIAGYKVTSSATTKNSNYNTQRIDLRNGLKDKSRLALTDQIKLQLERIGGKPRTNLYAEVHDQINLAITGERAKQMRNRASAEGWDIKDSDLIRDFFPTMTLQVYVSFCDNVTSFMRLETLDALCAIEKPQPHDYN